MNSKQFVEARECQLKTLLDIVKTSNSIVCGDFNIKHNISDVAEIGTEHTYFAHRFNNKNYSERYDRVICNDNIKCNFISYLGNEQYEFGYCSDHNGMVFNF